jgi:hypothetical protein
MYCWIWQYRYSLVSLLFRIIYFFFCLNNGVCVCVSSRYTHTLSPNSLENVVARLPSWNYLLRVQRNTQFLVFTHKNILYWIYYIRFFSHFFMSINVLQTKNFQWTEYKLISFTNKFDVKLTLCRHISFLWSLVKCFAFVKKKKK